MVFKVYPYVYRLDHKTSGEFYIGFRSRNTVPAVDDLGTKYFTSSNLVKQRFSEFDFVVVAEFFDSNDAYDFEQLLIHENWGNPKLVNKSCCYGVVPRFTTAGMTMSDQTKEKISAALKGKKLSAEHKAKLLAANIGRIHSPDDNAKKSKAHKGRKNTWNVGRPHTPEAKAKMSAVHKGKTLSAESLAKRRASMAEKRNNLIP